jgi:hypothetical protein
MADPESVQNVFNAAVSENATSDGGTPLLTKRAKDGVLYQRVKVTSGDTFVAGDLVYDTTAAAGNVQDDLTGISRNHARGFASAALGSATEARFGYVVRGGNITVNKVTGAGTAFAVGDQVIASATAKKVQKEVAGTAPTFRSLGYCRVAAADGDATVQIVATLD